MKRCTTRVLGLVGAAVLLVAGAGLGLVVPRLPAIHCLLGFQASVPDDLETNDDVPEGFELLTDRHRYGVDRAWLLRAASPRAPVLVFVHGVAPEGIRDGRIVNAVRAFGAAGFTVLAPELPTLVDPLAPGTPGAGTARLLAALGAGKIHGIRRDRIGVVGISVGGALALRACATFRREGGTGLRAVLAIGAPDDMRRPAVGWFAAEDTTPAGYGTLLWEQRNAAEFARNFLLRAGLRKRLGADPDLQKLADWMAEDPIPKEPLEGVTSKAVWEAALWLLAPADLRATERERVLHDAANRIEGLSPALWSDELAHLRGVQVFLLHGHGDPLVPIEEAAHLARRLRKFTVVSVLESHLVGHTSVEDVGFGEQLSHVVQMDDFFALIGR